MNLKNKILPAAGCQAPNKQNGFTLFETIIYIGIAGIILVSFVQYSLSVSNSKNKTYVTQEVQSNTRTALQIMTQKIRLADDVVSPAEGASDSVLILDMPNTGVNTVFSVQSGALSINEGSGEVSLTSNKVSVTGLSFTNAAAAGERDNINIQFTVEYANNGDIGFSASQTIQTSISLRR